MTSPRNRAPRVTVDCLHDGRHTHGTRVTYVKDRCRCEPCTDAARTYEQQRRRQRLYGIDNGRVDAQPVREHLAALSNAGIGYRRAAHLAGVSPTTVQSILYGRPNRRATGPAKHVKRDTAERILALTPGPALAAASTPIDSHGTARRIRALVARGWSQARLATRSGIGAATIQRILGGAPVTATTAHRIAALYEALWDQAPPEGTHRERIAASRARHYAAARGWAPPAAWDDIDADENPQPWATHLRRTPLDDRFDELDFLLSTGASLAEAARRCGWPTLDALHKTAHRAGRGPYGCTDTRAA